MKIALIVILAMVVTVAISTVIGIAFPGIGGVILSAVVGWLIGWYFVGPMIVKELDK